MKPLSTILRAAAHSIEMKARKVRRQELHGRQFSFNHGIVEPRANWLNIRSLPHRFKKAEPTLSKQPPALNRHALRGMAARERTREDISDEATTNFHRLPRRDWYKLHGKANKLKRARARLRRAYQYEQVAVLNEQVWV